MYVKSTKNDGEFQGNNKIKSSQTCLYRKRILHLYSFQLTDSQISFYPSLVSNNRTGCLLFTRIKQHQPVEIFSICRVVLLKYPFWWPSAEVR